MFQMPARSWKAAVSACLQQIWKATRLLSPISHGKLTGDTGGVLKESWKLGEEH